MHYTEIIAFLSLFVLMFLVILGFFGAFKLIVVLYQKCAHHIWFKRKRDGIPNLILSPVEQPIYQVNVDDSSLIAATQSIPICRRSYIRRKVEEKIIEEALLELVQRKHVAKSMLLNNSKKSHSTESSSSTKANNTPINHSNSIATSTSKSSSCKSINEIDLRYLTNITEMQRLVHNCWSTNFGHRESLSEEERRIQKLVLQVNLQIDNAAATGFQTDAAMALALEEIDPPLARAVQQSSYSSSSGGGGGGGGGLSPLTAAQRRHYYYFTSSSGRRPSPSTILNPNYPLRRSSSVSSFGGSEYYCPPPRFETLMIDHPDWPPSYENCIINIDDDDKNKQGAGGVGSSKVSKSNENILDKASSIEIEKV